MRERKQREKSIKRLLTKEQVNIANRTQWKYASVINRIETEYGFVDDHRKTKQQNAAQYLASMISWYYFDSHKKLLFRDLCTELGPPQKL